MGSGAARTNLGQSAGVQIMMTRSLHATKASFADNEDLRMIAWLSESSIVEFIETGTYTGESFLSQFKARQLEEAGSRNKLRVRDFCWGCKKSAGALSHIRKSLESRRRGALTRNEERSDGLGRRRGSEISAEGVLIADFPRPPNTRHSPELVQNINSSNHISPGPCTEALSFWYNYPTPRSSLRKISRRQTAFSVIIAISFSFYGLRIASTAEINGAALCTRCLEAGAGRMLSAGV
ncbi:hypothetical protein R3P38DRAFT_3548974 [Favolaschia claudopus]|uniref:Uncharacterized protein n=1 Tax=Favolaschia claudopus TaxID=2862362 RepID=A0AAW0B3B9_9AGAR